MVSAETFQQLFNQALNTVGFSSSQKNADVTPAFKKKNPRNKENWTAFYLFFQKYLKS